MPLQRGQSQPFPVLDCQHRVWRVHGQVPERRGAVRSRWGLFFRRRHVLGSCQVADVVCFMGRGLGGHARGRPWRQHEGRPARRRYLRIQLQRAAGRPDGRHHGKHLWQSWGWKDPSAATPRPPFITAHTCEPRSTPDEHARGFIPDGGRAVPRSSCQRRGLLAACSRIRAPWR